MDVEIQDNSKEISAAIKAALLRGIGSSGGVR